MLVYNVTLKVQWAIHDAWLRWMKEEHIPAMLQTGCFTEHTMLRLLDVDEEEGPTYAVQYQAENSEVYNRYIAVYAPAMREAGIKQWGDAFIAFRTLMEIVH